MGEEAVEPRRDRSVTSFMVMSPQSARSYPHLPLSFQRRGEEKEKEERWDEGHHNNNNNNNNEEEEDEMEPTAVVMAALPRHNPPPPRPSSADPVLFPPVGNERFSSDDVEDYIDSIL